MGRPRDLAIEDKETVTDDHYHLICTSFPVTSISRDRPWKIKRKLRWYYDRALEYSRRALKVNPNMDGVRRNIE